MNGFCNVVCAPKHTFDHLFAFCDCAAVISLVLVRVLIIPHFTGKQLKPLVLDQCICNTVANKKTLMVLVLSVW